MKAQVVKYLRELTADAGQGYVLQISSGQPGLPGNNVPTLLHIAEVLKQAGFLSIIPDRSSFRNPPNQSHSCDR